MIVEIPANADITEIEQHVPGAGRQAMREAIQKAVQALLEQGAIRPVRLVMIEPHLPGETRFSSRK